jgi:hypothetical protein
MDILEEPVLQSTRHTPKYSYIHVAAAVRITSATKITNI